MKRCYAMPPESGKPDTLLKCASAIFTLFSLYCAGYAGDHEDAPTFANDIAPILYKNCVVCHNPKGVGPFSLIEYQQVRKRGGDIAEVVASRYMPPWKPSPEYGPSLRNARGLDESEIQKIQHWVASGSHSGDLAKVLPVPKFPTGWTLGEPDVVLEFPEPYTLSADGIDSYRNFVIPFTQATTRYVKAVEFLPQTHLSIHHAVIFMDESSWSRSQDAEDETPGFGSMNLSGLSNPQEGIFIGWAPGSMPYEAYPGTEWKLSPRVDFVVQLHMLPTGKPEKISPKIGIYLSDRPPTKPSAFLLLSAPKINIPAGEANYLVRESIHLPMETHILGVFPHAHFLGKDMKIYADLPDGGRQGLLWIPDWDFNWQTDYRFKVPLTLPADSRLVMEYIYDNSAENLRNPFSPPQPIRLGFRSIDEMGEVAIHLFLNSPDDLPKLDRMRLDYEIEREGGLAPYYHKIGRDYRAAGDLERAEDMLRSSLRVNPRQSKVYNTLGNLLEERGLFNEVESQYQAALAEDPSYLEAKINLAHFLFQEKGEGQRALRLTQEILRGFPSEFQASILQSNILVSLGRPSAALKVLSTCAQENPKESYPQLLLGQVHLVRGDLEEARTYLQDVADGGFENLLSTQYETGTVIKANAFYSLALIAQIADDVVAFKRNLQGALLHHPWHVEALLFSAALAYLEEDRVVARSFMKRLLAISAEKIPSAEYILSLMPFPHGPEMIVTIHLAADRKEQAREVIEVAIASAGGQGRQDWVERFVDFAQDQGIMPKFE